MRGAGLAASRAPIPGVGAFDVATSVYNMKGGALRKARAAVGKAVAGAGLCEIAWAGPSTAQGYPNPIRTQSPPAVLLSRLVARGLPASSGWTWTGNNLSTPQNVDSRWSATGWSLPYLSLGFKSPSARSNASGNTITYTSVETGTVVEWFVTGIWGAYTYTIDGGAPVSVTAGGSATQAPILKQVTGLANTTHTLVIATTTATNVFVAMARVRPTSGILVTNAGWGGSQSAEWDTTTDANDFFSLQPALRFGGAPDLVIFDAYTWVNDYLMSAWTAAQSQAALTRIVNQIKAAGSDVILLSSAAPSATVAFSTFSTIPDATYQQFRQGLYAVADSTGVPLIDSPDRIGDWAAANTSGLTQDGLHLNPSGNAALARSVESLLVA